MISQLIYEKQNTSDLVTKEKEALKTFFPSLYRSVKGTIQLILPPWTDPINSENLYFESKTSGLKTNHFLNSSPQPNAYTLPATSTRIGAMAAQLSSIFYYLYGIIELSNNPISAKVEKNNSIKFSTSFDGRIGIFHTLGLHDMLNKDQRFAVSLHEIGHWINYKSSFASLTSIFSANFIGRLIQITGNTVALYVFFPVAIAAIAFSRAAEWRSDAFVKSVGYDKKFVEALDIIGYKKRDTTSIYNKIEDYVRVIFTHIDNIVQTVLPIGLHPSIKARKKALTESQIVYEGLILDKITDVLLKPCHELDKIISQHVQDLFPLAR